MNKSNIETFISKAKEFHNNKYDYSLVVYINNNTKVKIICPIHGEFEQLPRSHCYYGCKKCSVDNKKDTVDIFINKAKKIHNNKYDYSLINYINSDTKIKIICPQHGVFEQKPTVHLYNKGCPSCSSSKGELKIRDFLVSNNILFEEQKRFDLCKSIYTLPFDFYLPKYNLLIEYQGEHHYMPIEGWGGDSTFNKVKVRDKIKKDFCLKNNLKLIEIPFYEKANIEELLNNLI